MHEWIHKAALLLGISDLTAALIIGALLGFILRSLVWGGGRRLPPVMNTSATIAAPPRIKTAVPPSDAMRSGLSPAQTDEIHALLRKGDKLHAIKRYRECTNLGLAEAKSAVEAIERDVR